MGNLHIWSMNSNVFPLHQSMFLLRTIQLLMGMGQVKLVYFYRHGALIYLKHQLQCISFKLVFCCLWYSCVWAWGQVKLVHLKHQNKCSCYLCRCSLARAYVELEFWSMKFKYIIWTNLFLMIPMPLGMGPSGALNIWRQYEVQSRALEQICLVMIPLPMGMGSLYIWSIKFYIIISFELYSGTIR